MKALILVAGLGTRLRPITDNIPKPLVLIGGKPLLWYHLESLRKCGVSEILINKHYLPDMIEKFITEYNNQHSEIFVNTVFEAELLGSAGTLRQNFDFFKDEENFFVVYGDNLTNINYKRLLNVHLNKNGVATIASYYENHPESKGIIVYDSEKKISGFIEKPQKEQIFSNWANAGVYILNRRILQYLGAIDSLVMDFGRDLFPYIITSGGKMFIYEMDEFLLDIGTIESYNLAQEKIKEIKF
jgi:NDP-sugar pyrophosphorylase family protein